MTTDACRSVCIVCLEWLVQIPYTSQPVPNSLVQGLYEQLARFVSEHRDTRLIIIDTLQKIREASGDRYSYASDYEIIGQLKHFADQTGIALLLVHHTRKQQADDKFDMISEPMDCSALPTELLFCKRKNAPEILRYWKCQAEISRSKD